MPAQTRNRFAVVLWLVGVATIVFVGLVRWPQSEWLKTEFTALLPASSVSPRQIQANAAATAAFENQLVVVVAGKSAEAAGSFLHVVDETLRSGGYVQDRPEETEEGKWRSLSERLYPYRWSLLAPADREALKHDPAGSLEHFRRLLYSPLGGSMASTLGSDPAGLYRNFLQAASPEASVTARTLVGQVKATEVALYQVPALARARGAELYTAYVSLREQAAALGLAMHATGAPLYSGYGLLSGEREISTIGLVSLIVLVSMLVAVLRSFSAILLTLVCVSSGVFAGWILTVAILQEIHVLTLVFGATIIGISADYAFHYLAHTTVGSDGRSTLDNVFTGLVTGMATSVVAFIGLTVLPFPGLRQIGVFMAVGLLASFLTVCLLFPVLHRSIAPGVRVPTFCTRSQIPTPKSWCILLLVTLAAIPGLLSLEFSSDVRDFYAAPDNLLEDQEAIIHALGGAADSRYLLVRATDTEALLQAEERLREAVGATSGTGNAARLGGISSLIPSAAHQRENLAIQRMLINGEYLQAHMHELGFSNAAQRDALAGFPEDFRALTPAVLEGLQLPVGLGGFLGCDAAECASWLPVPNKVSAHALSVMLASQPGVVLVDPVADINNRLARFHGTVLLVLGAGSGLITVMLALFWGWRLALRLAMLPVMSCVFSLAVCGYIDGHYSIVNLLALLLIIGVGLDYAIFRAFTRAEDQPATSLAIALSALTSVLAFGMLAFSSTPLIASFGQTIAFGLVFAYLLSWCRFGVQA
jgi:predicted exporter